MLTSAIHPPLPHVYTTTVSRCEAYSNYYRPGIKGLELKQLNVNGNTL